jgi:glycosyltransferase involved in cell wall biosynthesis
VSVVIPVYNSESYLSECLDSVISQSLEDVEVVCVNDGSSDGSKGILEQYASRDRRITVIDQPNRGPSAARNVGTAAAKGEYIYFLDSDDFIDADALESLYERARSDELDVLYFGATPFFEDSTLEKEHSAFKSYYRRSREYPGVMSGRQLMSEMSDNHDYRPSVVFQLIRRGYYERTGLSFYEGILHEDNLFTFLCALQADRAAYVPQTYYHRRVRADSIMTAQKTVAHFRGYFVCYLQMLRFSMQSEFDDATSRVVARVCEGMYRQALKVLCGLSKEDKADVANHVDTSPDSLLTLSQLRRQAKDQLTIERLEKELKTSNRKLEQVRTSRAYRIGRLLRRLLRGGKSRR